MADSAQLDYETTPSFTLLVEVTDIAGLTDTATIKINLIDDTSECIETEAQLRTAAAAGGEHCVDTTQHIVLTTGEVAVATSLTLTTAGPANAVINANSTSRVFNVTGSLTLNGMTITGGLVAGNGGGVYIDGGSLVMNGNSTITGNTAHNGGGVYVPQTSPAGSVTMNDSSKIEFNSVVPMGAPVAVSGGGLSLNSGILVMNGSSTISNNNTNGAYAAGAGILNNVGQHHDERQFLDHREHGHRTQLPQRWTRRRDLLRQRGIARPGQHGLDHRQHR